MNMSYTLPRRRAAVRLTGAVYTPSDVAAAVLQSAIADLPARRLRILEPSVGDGAFLGQLSVLIPDHDYTAIDIDEEVVESLRDSAHLWPQSTVLITSDFINYACNAIVNQGARFDLIVGNPPFIRKHNFSDAFKEELTRLSLITSYPLQNLKNSWAAFLVASSKLLSDDGIVAFVLPYELVTVAYGHKLLTAMLDVFPRIDLFVSEEKAFPEIEQDAVIFIGRRKPTDTTGLFIQSVSTMSQLSSPVEHSLSLAEARPLALDLNAFLIAPATMPTLRRLQKQLNTFADLATSAPGVVTAANEFFILRDADVEANGLQSHVLPILKKQNLLDRSPVFSAQDFEALAKREPCRLLHVKGEFQTLDSELKAYLSKGEQSEIHKRYKCRERKNWYEVPLVQSAPGFFFKRSHGYPRICVNDANVHITDTAYGIRPKDGYTMRGICFSFYNSVTMLFAETNGRFYGGGVLELAPNELKNLPVIYHEPTDEQFANFLLIHRKAGNDPTAILDFGDEWLSNHAALSGVDLKLIRAAWLSVRSHRLRHSSRTKSNSSHESAHLSAAMAPIAEY